MNSETLNKEMANDGFATVSVGNTGYDGGDRFIRYIRSGVSEDIQLTRSHIGNISNVNRNGTNTARAYNNAHGLTTVSGGVTQTYDLDGNTTKLNTNVTASWDDAGRTMNTNTPTGATAGVAGFNEYGYVGGTRVWKKINQNGTIVHRVYVHAGPNLIAEYNAGVGASTPVQEYIYADQIDSLVMIHRSNNQKLGVTRNRQWSVVGLHDLANGNVVERYAYDMSGKRTIYAANGTTVRTTSSFGNNFGYTSRWHDEESGLINFRARHYNPLTGEFLRRDPLGFEDGMSLYRGYMELGWVDPTGTVKIACECRRSGGRIQEYVVDCKGLRENCCNRQCNPIGYWTGNARTVSRPEFARTHNADDIASQNYVPGIGTYFSRYVFAWETPHPADPYDLALTRGKLIFGIPGAAFLAARFGGPTVLAGGRIIYVSGSHYGRSTIHRAVANPNATTEILVGFGGASAGLSPDVRGRVAGFADEAAEIMANAARGGKPMGIVAMADESIVITEETVRAAMKDAPLLSQQANGVSLKLIQEYVKKLLSGSSAPPIKVDKGMIVDGNHTYIAGRICGKEPPIQPWIGGRPGNAVPWDELPIDPENVW